MAKYGDDFWMREKTAPDGTEVRVLATKRRTAQWSVSVEKGQDTTKPLWVKTYEDEDLPDATDGDAVIEHAWEECHKELGLG